jgi:predicted enzyme related to lactoylglutathione lyase
MDNPDQRCGGDFSWIELVTADPFSWRNFYIPLFGWSVPETPSNRSPFYTVFNVNGHPAGSVYSAPTEPTVHDSRSHWKLYIDVQDAEAAAAKVVSFGGTVLERPREGYQNGLTAVLQDPVGASFAICETGRGIKIANSGDREPFAGRT